MSDLKPTGDGGSLVGGRCGDAGGPAARLQAGSATSWAGGGPRGEGVGPPRAGVLSVLSASLGRGADNNSQKDVASRAGAGAEAGSGEAGGPQRPLPLLAVSLELRLSVFFFVSVSPCVCLSVSVGVSLSCSLTVSL